MEVHSRSCTRQQVLDQARVICGRHAWMPHEVIAAALADIDGPASGCRSSALDCLHSPVQQGKSVHTLRAQDAHGASFAGMYCSVSEKPCA